MQILTDSEQRQAKMQKPNVFVIYDLKKTQSEFTSLIQLH